MTSPAAQPVSVRRTALLFALLAVAALALTVYATAEAAPLPSDAWVTRHVQAMGWFSAPAGAVNLIGDRVALPFTVVVLVVVFGSRMPWRAVASAAERRGAIAGLLLLVPLTVVDNVLKRLVGSPRPQEADGVRVDYFRDSYGFPSGHVFHDVLLLGAMAMLAPLWLPRRWVWPARALLTLIIVLSGPARVFVGAHWPSDTIGGYLWGGAALLGGLALGNWLAQRAAASVWGRAS